MKVEDELKAELRRKADAVRPSPAAWDEITKRVEHVRPAREHHGSPGVRRAVVVVFALAVAVAGLAFAVRAFSPTKNSEHQFSIGGAIPSGVGSTFFPTQKAPANGYPDALLQGKLEDRSGCIVVGHGEHTTLPIWPYGYRLARSGSGKLQVIAGDGSVVARIGQLVGMGGGLVGESPNAVGFAQQLIGGPIPDRCRAGGYWLASGVSTNPRFTH